MKSNKKVSSLALSVIISFGLLTNFTIVNVQAKASKSRTSYSTKKKKVVTSTSRSRTSNKRSVSSQSRRKPSRGEVVGTDKGFRVIEKAYDKLGSRYVWGAEGSNAFDCSGFTRYIYKCFGINLPHYTGAQVTRGSKVSSKSQLRAGDLVFFNTGQRNSHVGIYIGYGKFVHASSGAGRVIISDLSNSYYSSNYSTARRILR